MRSVWAVLLSFWVACSSPTPEVLPLPPGFPPPRIPTDNLLTAQKVELGRFLFYDQRLSGNGTQACASCHKQEQAFTDGRALGLGSTGELHSRSPMSLANVVYAPSLTWANPLLVSLEQQALVPLFGEHPVELGLAGKEDELLLRLRAQPQYQRLFAEAFPEQAEPISLHSIQHALSSFQRTLVSGRSAYDRYAYDHDQAALSDAAKRGMDLFFSERLECFHCHGGFLFADAVHQNTTFDEANFHNNGLYNLDVKGSYPSGNQGVYELTGKDRDRGRFRAPSLRNIAVTAPYMHDGSLATLEDVLAHYARGGRLIPSGPNAGDGARNPNKSVFVRPFELSQAERADVIEFLRSLTDFEFLKDPRFASPF